VYFIGRVEHLTVQLHLMGAFNYNVAVVSLQVSVLQAHYNRLKTLLVFNMVQVYTWVVKVKLGLVFSLLLRYNH
jgi:hypothetical protein